MIKSKRGRGVTSILLGAFVAGVGLFLAPRLNAALLAYRYPSDKDVLVDRSFDPADFSAVSSGGAITVTIDVTNNEGVDLRGFYYSDHVPSEWVVDTASVSVNGSPITDYTYGQGYAGEVYTDSIPHRWALEMPQEPALSLPKGDGVFSPTHSIPASGGTARIVYTMIVSGGTGSDYSIGYEAWAGWLETTPNGTAIFGYETIPSPPTADFTASLLSGTAPLTVTFTDRSEGIINAWLWDFGDGFTSAIQHPSHTYITPGQFGVTLTVSGPGGSGMASKPDYIVVDPAFAPPVADFTASLLSGTAPLTLTFTDRSEGIINAWLWDFGDGFTSAIQHPTHTYAICGVYTITLTVTRTEPAASDTVVKPEYITVTAPLLQADFIASPLFGLPPLTVEFTDLSVGDILTYAWDFGEGGTASLPGPTYTYSALGYYTVSLTVQDACGSDTLVRPQYIHVTDVIYNVYLPVILKDYVP